MKSACLDKFADVHVHNHTYDYSVSEAFLDNIAGQGVTDVAIQALTMFGVTENLAALNVKRRYDKMGVRVFGNVHDLDFLSEIPYEKQAEYLLNIGCDGIKSLVMKPDYRKKLGKGINHSSFDKMFSMLEERQVPVMIHSNDPSYFWDIERVGQWNIDHGRFYGVPGYLSYKEVYEETFEMLDKHQKLNVTLAHLFFLHEDIAEARRVLEKYPNVKFDLTPGWEMYIAFSEKIEEWHDFFVEYQDRILFGTDRNTTSTDEHCNNIQKLVINGISHDYSEFKMPCYRDNMIKGLSLSEDIIRKICYENFEKFVGSKMEVDEQKFVCACENMADRLKKNGGYEKECEAILGFTK